MLEYWRNNFKLRFYLYKEITDDATICEQVFYNSAIEPFKIKYKLIILSKELCVKLDKEKGNKINKIYKDVIK